MILVAAVIVVLILHLRLLPSINWPASSKPGQVERKLADYVTSEWVRRHAAKQTKPLNMSPENLKAGQGDFEEHCATFRGLDGCGENRFDADFYPPVAKLTDDVQEWSDGELYFIVANGIPMSGMPGFARNHDSKEIWGMVLWVRYLAQLRPPEKAALESRAQMTTDSIRR